MAQTQTQVATAQNNSPIAVLQRSLSSATEEIGKALPGHITPEKFIRTAQTAIALTRNIEKIKDPRSLMLACSKAAADGLILDGREAALVVDYNGEAQYRPMMRGLLKLAYQSGAVSSISVQLVCQNDVFHHYPSDPKPIEHEIDYRGERGPTFLVYGVAHLKDGSIVHEVMTIDQINKIRDRSDAWKAFKKGSIKSTPWETDWDEMARKTVFRRLSKYLPSSTDRAFQSAVERIDEDYSFDPPVYDNDPETQPQPRQQPKKRGGAAAALKDVTPRKAEQAQQRAAHPNADTDGVVDEGYGDMMHGNQGGASDDI